MAITFNKLALAPLLSGMKNAHAFVTKGYEHVKANNIDPEDFLTARLAPDMQDFRYQIYRFTDSAKLLPPRLNPSIEALPLPDEEKTFEELLGRIEKTIKYIESIDDKAFEGREDAEVMMKFGGGKVEINFKGLEYVQAYAHPNFWFHITTTYALLRHKGVDVGKFDYLNGAGLITVTRHPQ